MLHSPCTCALAFGVDRKPQQLDTEMLEVGDLTVDGVDEPLALSLVQGDMDAVGAKHHAQP